MEGDERVIFRTSEDQTNSPRVVAAAVRGVVWSCHSHVPLKTGEFGEKRVGGRGGGHAVSTKGSDRA